MAALTSSFSVLANVKHGNVRDQLVVGLLGAPLHTQHHQEVHRHGASMLGFNGTQIGVHGRKELRSHGLLEDCLRPVVALEVGIRRVLVDVLLPLLDPDEVVVEPLKDETGESFTIPGDGWVIKAEVLWYVVDGSKVEPRGDGEERVNGLVEGSDS